MTITLFGWGERGERERERKRDRERYISIRAIDWILFLSMVTMNDWTTYVALNRVFDGISFEHFFFL